MDRSMVHWKDNPFTLMQPDHLGSGLHSRSLLGENELASGKILRRI
jgi:hypothetical protein